jgi:DNA-binding transcriptional LysR family regulator
MHNLNWDDLRFVLAVADTGSVNAAAKALGVNHATVLRRIASFEEASGGPVFERSSTGYRLRPDRAPVIEAARLAAQHVRSVEVLMRGGTAGSGTVLRLTSTDSLCQTLLAWIFPALSRRLLPDSLTYVVSNPHLDMARLSADLSVRPAMSLTDDLNGHEIGRMGFASYVRAGVSQDGAGWLGLSGALSRSIPARWMSENVDPSEIQATADSFCALTEIAAVTGARVILPCVLGDSHPALTRDQSTAVPDFSVPVWVACHRDVAGSDRIKNCMEVITRLARPHADRLRGTLPDKPSRRAQAS